MRNVCYERVARVFPSSLYCLFDIMDKCFLRILNICFSFLFFSFLLVVINLLKTNGVFNIIVVLTSLLLIGAYNSVSSFQFTPYAKIPLINSDQAFCFNCFMHAGLFPKTNQNVKSWLHFSMSLCSNGYPWPGD